MFEGDIKLNSDDVQRINDNTWNRRDAADENIRMRGDATVIESAKWPTISIPYEYGASMGMSKIIR